ncbi:NUDIX domain-containing protein [Patescibacteria group bacterium]|nr:NUDIX domain-containing protein [Patescibacteria group bacterium]
MKTKNKINVRVRLVVIHNKKVLVQYREMGKFYHYIGGHLEYGETIENACEREVGEECGRGVEFDFQKILYIRDFIDPNEEGHSVEFFILGSINKTDNLEGLKDPQHPDGSVWLTWLDIKNLPDNLLPKTLSQKLLDDFNDGFPKEGEYIGEIK